MSQAVTTPPNQAAELIRLLSEGRQDDNKPFATRRRLGLTLDLIQEGFAAVREEQPTKLIEHLKKMQASGQLAGDSELMNYLTNSFLAVARALLIQTGDYDPAKKGAEASGADQPADPGTGATDSGDAQGV